MDKVTFILSEVKESPKSRPRVIVEMKFEPVSTMRKDGPLKDMAEYIIEAIDDFKNDRNGEHKITEVKRG